MTDPLEPLMETLRPAHLRYSTEQAVGAWLQIKGWTMGHVMGYWAHGDDERGQYGKTLGAAVDAQVRWERQLSNRAAATVKPPPPKRR